MKFLLLSICLIFLVAACGSTASKPSSTTPEQEPFHRIVLISAGDGASYNLGRPNFLDTQYRTQEAIIAKECSVSADATGTAIAPVLGVIFGSLVKAGISLSVGAIDSRLKKELKKHSIKYSAFKALDKNTLANLKCLRFVRGVSDTNGDTLHMDFIVKLEQVPGNEGARLIPLRLYVGKPGPTRPSSTNKYGIAISMTTTHATNQSYEKSPEILVLKDKYELPIKDKSGNEVSEIVKYYNRPSGKFCQDAAALAKHQLACRDDPAIQYVAVPVGAPVDPVTPVGISLSAAETGTPDKYLSTLSKLFSEAKKGIGDGLGELAAKKLGFEE